MIASDSESRDMRDRVLDAAARLFSHLGYDATTTQMIADVVGLDVATMIGQVGDKRRLYAMVLERFTETELAYMKTALADFTPDLPGLIRVADAYLDFCLDHPEFPALIMHRWLWDAADTAETDMGLLWPIQKIPLGEMEKGFALRNGGGRVPFDLELAGWSIVWCVNGFVQGGFLDDQGRLRGPRDPRALERFRQYMHQMVERMSGLER